VHPRRPCPNRRQLGFQPVAFPGGLRGRGGGFTSCRTGGAGSPRTADGPSSSATSVSSPTGRRLPQRVNTASPPSSASTSPTISHPMRPPHPPGFPRRQLRQRRPPTCRHPRAHQSPGAICNHEPQRCQLGQVHRPLPWERQGPSQRETPAAPRAAGWRSDRARNHPRRPRYDLATTPQTAGGESESQGLQAGQPAELGRPS